MSILRRMVYASGMMIRETGQALDRLGSRMQGKYAFTEQLSRHRQIMNLEMKKPIISTNVFIAPNASIIGQVELHPTTSIWYGTVLRGDTSPITIGETSCIQDRAVILPSTSIGSSSMIGFGAVVDGANIGSNCVVGAGSVVSKGVKVGDGSVIKEASYVEPGVYIGDGEVWSGSPAKMERMVTKEEKVEIGRAVGEYVDLAAAHAQENGKTAQQIEAEALRQALLEERSEDYNSHLGLIGKEAEVVETQARVVEAERAMQRQA